MCKNKYLVYMLISIICAVIINITSILIEYFFGNIIMNTLNGTTLTYVIFNTTITIFLMLLFIIMVLYYLNS